MRCSPSVSMMSTAMSRNLPSYSRAWWPQKTRSLPLASTTRTLANAPQRSQWDGTTRSSVGGVVVSVWVIWSSLALYRTDPQLRIGLLHSARMDPGIPAPVHSIPDSPVAVRPVTDGTDGGARSRGRHWCRAQLVVLFGGADGAPAVRPVVGPLPSLRAPRYAAYPGRSPVHDPSRADG